MDEKICHLKINNNHYKVIFVEENDERLEVDNDDYRSGITDFIKKEIYINKNLNVDSMRYTILHELSHAYLESYGFLQVKYDDEIISDIIGNYLINIHDDYLYIANCIEKDSD